MSDETTLLPCPFCGGKAALRMCWMEDGHRYRAVECVECGATTPGNYSEVGDQSTWDWNARTPEQAIAATLGKPKARAHPYGYEPDTGAFDCTRCECGCINDISAKYCNDCGGEIEIDMYAEKEIYRTPRHLVFAEKHDDGSLEFCERRYVPESDTHGMLTAEQVMAIAGRHQPDYCSDTHVCFDWQAIADELNATVGNGTCEMDFIETHEYPDGDEDYLCECSNCGRKSWEPAHDLPNFCARCGRAVKR